MRLPYRNNNNRLYLIYKILRIYIRRHFLYDFSLSFSLSLYLTESRGQRKWWKTFTTILKPYNWNFNKFLIQKKNRIRFKSFKKNFQPFSTRFYKKYACAVVRFWRSVKNQLLIYRFKKKKNFVCLCLYAFVQISYLNRPL